MKTWKGTIFSKEFSAEVTIYHTTPSATNLGEWHGNGSITPITIMPGSYETNIGTIVITQVEISSALFEFHGSGKLNIL